MVGKRAKAGIEVFSDLLIRCSVSVCDLRGETFMKLLELVDSVFLYGMVVWGCFRQLAQNERVWMRAVRIFLGVGRLHPKVSL